MAICSSVSFAGATTNGAARWPSSCSVRGHFSRHIDRYFKKLFLFTTGYIDLNQTVDDRHLNSMRRALGMMIPARRNYAAFVLVLILLAGSLCAPRSVVAAEPARIALLIGNSAYDD